MIFNEINEGAGVEIPLSDEKWKQWSEPWTEALIVKVMGKRTNFKSLENNLQKKWPKKGSIKIVDIPDGYFLVHFTFEEDYAFVLFEGPWTISDYYLIVQRWRPVFLQNAEIVKKVAIWVRIPHLLMELYNSQFLGRIGSSPGTMLKVDRLTSIHSRGQYARICVEIDLEKPLKSFIVIRGHKILIEYEGLHLICFHCGRYGHKSTQCAELNGGSKVISQGQIQTSAVQVIQPSQQKKDDNALSEKPVEETKFGAWMVVAPRRPRKTQKPVPVSSGDRKSLDSNLGDKKLQVSGVSKEKNAKGSGSRSNSLSKGNEPLKEDKNQTSDKGLSGLNKIEIPTNVASSSGSKKADSPSFR